MHRRSYGSEGKSLPIENLFGAGTVCIASSHNLRAAALSFVPPRLLCSSL